MEDLFEGQQVVILKIGVFRNIKHITVPPTVKAIRPSAFHECLFKDVNLSEGPGVVRTYGIQELPIFAMNKYPNIIGVGTLELVHS